MLERNPQSVRAHVGVATVYKALHQPELAEASYRTALQLNPISWEALEGLATLLNLNGRHLESINLLKDALELIPKQGNKIKATPAAWTKYLTVWHSLGEVYITAEMYYEAAIAFASVVALALNLSEWRPIPENLGLSTQSGSSSDNTNSLFLVELTKRVKKAFNTNVLGIGPHQALACKHELLKNGKLPVQADSPEWAAYASSVPSATSSTPLDIVTSNALLNLAKIFQDGLSSGIPSRILYVGGMIPSQADILALYMFSLSLNPSPSTANNIGILLASLSSSPNHSHVTSRHLAPSSSKPCDLAVEYYSFGLSFDAMNPHIYTNLGSLLREQGKAQAAINMYQKAVECNPTFNIALTNLASALRDQGRIDETIKYYRRAVDVAPDFVEAVSGLANAMASVCDWRGRGGYGWEQVSVDDAGMLVEGQRDGWVQRIVRIVERQIQDARRWGIGIIAKEQEKSRGGGGGEDGGASLMADLEAAFGGFNDEQKEYWQNVWDRWKNKKDEGTKIVQLIECATKSCQRRWYLEQGTDVYRYRRPRVPARLPIPLATSILPFHAFTLPFSAQQVSQIAIRTSMRISMSALTQSWLPDHVFPPPPPPQNGRLTVGYVSSDFLDHPLSHLMQSVFGFHTRSQFNVICYATTPSDDSAYRAKIEQESHVFKDVSGWPTEKVVNEILSDGVHILVNLNGFTRGARNDIFAVRPCPVQIALIGFAGSLGGGWCDYLLGDVHSIGEHHDTSVYRESIIYMPGTFFCCDHKQSAPDSRAQRELRAASSLGRIKRHQSFNSLMESVQASANKLDQLEDILYIPGELSWKNEQLLRGHLRRALFPHLQPGAFLMTNLNQLYKIDPTTFRVWLNVLQRLPHAYLWLLQFPKSGEAHLKATARRWTNNDTSVVDRILFTPVAAKAKHILRSRIADVFLDTPECNAHTTAADVIWTGTPIVTFKRHAHKMCSRIAASILNGALTPTGGASSSAAAAATTKAAFADLVVDSESAYEDRVVWFGGTPAGAARLTELRKLLFEGREKSVLFNTRGWVHNVERGYQKAWEDWVLGERRDIYINEEEEEDGNGAAASS